MKPRPVAPLFGNWPYDPTTALLTLRSGHQLAGILATVGFSVKQDLSLLCAAFHGEWAIDSPALLAAKQVTQFHRLRGLASSRLRQGRKLVLDAMHWLGSRGMQHALVNTDSANAAALSLYGSLGFAPMSYSLYVLERACTD